MIPELKKTATLEVDFEIMGSLVFILKFRCFLRDYRAEILMLFDDVDDLELCIFRDYGDMILI